jgi:hypothetical protein
LFSSIGYVSTFIRISDLKGNSNTQVILKGKIYDLTEVVIRPKVFKEKIIGVTSKNKNVSAGFKDNLLGYECGVLMKVKKTALIRKVNINIANCLYDTIFYRINIYKVNDPMDFENILTEPIYVEIPRDLIGESIEIDLESKKLIVMEDFLVTLEHTKDLGSGYLYFCAGLGKTYFRKTSQGKWETQPIGISISVLTDVEK